MGTVGVDMANERTIDAASVCVYVQFRLDNCDTGRERLMDRSIDPEGDNDNYNGVSACGVGRHWFVEFVSHCVTDGRH